MMLLTPIVGMIGTVHMVAALAVYCATYLLAVHYLFRRKSPIAYITALIVAFFSHFLLDALPHFEYLRLVAHIEAYHYVIAGGDMFVGMVVTALLLVAVLRFDEERYDDFSRISLWRFGLAYIAAFLGAFPDALTWAHHKLSISQLKWFFDFHHLLHTKIDGNNLLGIMTQVVTTVGSVWLLYFLRKNHNFKEKGLL